MVNGMLLSVGLGMVAMCVILAAEILIVGNNQERLSWPYGDLVPGNYLAKACLPAFVVVVAIATSSRGGIASCAAIIALVSIVASVMTGERVNFLIRAFSGMLAAIAWRPRLYRVIAIFAVEGIAILTAIMSAPGLFQRFVDQFLQQLPTHGDSPYFRAMAPGWLAFQEAPLFGIGPGNLRLLCDDIIAGSSLYDCHPHPHNFYLQMLGEAGIIGFLTGVLFLGSVIWACARPALRDRSNVVVATMWIVPFGFSGQSLPLPTSSVSGTISLCGALWLWHWQARRSAARPVRHKDLISPRSVSA